MGLVTSAALSLGTAFAKFLFKKYVGESYEVAGVAGESLLDVGKDKIKDALEHRKAARQFEDIADRIVSKLRTSFEEAEQRNSALDYEAISNELAMSLQSRVQADFFLAGDLDPPRLTEAFRQARPLPAGALREPETAFYNRALEEAVRSVVEVAAALPRFEATFAAQSLIRLRNIGADIDEVLSTVKHIEVSVTAKNLPQDEQRFEINYRQAVVRNLDRVDLFGADIPPESQRHLLTEAFVSLNVDSDKEKGETELLSIETALDRLRPKAGRLLIRGNAGSGKTTLMRWAAIEAAKGDNIRFPLIYFAGHGRTGTSIPWQLMRDSPKKLDIAGLIEPVRIEEVISGSEDGSIEFYEMSKAVSQKTESQSLKGFFDGQLIWHRRLPFLLLLRHCQDGRLPPPEEFPLAFGKEVGCPPEEWVTRVLKQGRGLILIDGIDEVPSGKRSAVYDALESLLRAFPDNYYVLTTRPDAVPEGWLGRLGFHESRVSPMSENDVKRFVDRWHEALGKELARRSKRADDLRELGEALKKKLTEDPALSLLATNPLLCAMICALHRERYRKLPENQRELCEALCHMLLYRRDRESGFEWERFAPAYRDLGYPQRRAVVQDIAQYMVLNDLSSLDRNAALMRTGAMLTLFPGRAPEDAPDVLNGLVERSGMLRATTTESIDFLHNTFKEFLAGDHCADESHAGTLAKRAVEDAAWQRVALFAAATPTNVHFASQLVRAVFDLPAPKTVKKGSRKGAGADALHARHLFLLRCRAVAAYLDRDLEERIGGLLAELFPPGSFADAESLAALGNIAVPHLTPKQKLTPTRAAACVRALRLINTAEAKAALQAFHNETRLPVLVELAQAINPLSLPAVQEMVQKEEGISDGIREQVIDLSPLTGLAQLQSLYLNFTSVTDLAPLAGLSQLLTLNLNGTPVTDLAPLAKLTQLESLGLLETKVTDLTPLEGLPQLQSLGLGNTKVTDLTPLGALSQLKSLYLNGTLVTDLAPLEGLTQLQSLYLGATRVTNLGPLAEFTQLQSLDLDCTKVTDLTPLIGNTQLKSLELRATMVTNFELLTRFTQLQRLYLNSTRVKDLAPLAGLTQLLTLDLNDTPTIDLAPLADLSPLLTLNLNGTPVTDLAPLVKLTKLQSLYLSGTSVTDLAPLAGLKQLLTLDLNDTPTTDLAPLAEITQLKSLNLFRTAVKDLAPLAGLTQLLSLGLSNTLVTDLAPLAGLTQLQSLDIRATLVTDLAPLAGFTRLRSLNLIGTSVTDLAPLAGLTQLKQLYLTANRAYNLSLLRLLTHLSIGYGGDETENTPVEPVPTVTPGVTEGGVIPASIQLRRLDLEDFRGFERESFTFTEAVTVLIGDNGTGKTAILEALAACLTEFCEGFDGIKGRPLGDDDLRRVTALQGDRPTVQAREEVRVRCKGMIDGSDLEWTTSYRRDQKDRNPPQASLTRMKAVSLQRKLQRGESVTLPVIVYHSTGRLWRNRLLVPNETMPTGSRAHGYLNCLDPESIEVDMPLWFKTREWEAQQKKQPPSDLLAVQNAVAVCMKGLEGSFLGDWKTVVYDVQMDELVGVFADGRRLPFRQLSDGVRNLLALVADIAIRAAMLNPMYGADAARKSPGIVLIDEIDLHLHPRWQRRVLDDLRRTFEKMQFIVTTHSPFIVQSLRAGELLILGKPGQAEGTGGETVHEDLRKKSVEDVVENQMGVAVPQRSQRYQQMHDTAERYYQLLQQAQPTDPAELERLKAELDALIAPFSDDPAYHAFLSMKRVAAGVGE